MTLLFVLLQIENVEQKKGATLQKVLSKAWLTKVTGELYYYQLLCIYSVDGVKCRTLANNQTVILHY